MEEEAKESVAPKHRSSQAILVVIAGEQAVPEVRPGRAETAHSAALTAAVMRGRPATAETRVSHLAVDAAEAAVAWEDKAVAAAAADWVEEVVQVAEEVAEEVEADE